MTLIPFTWTVNGTLTDATSVKLSDPTGTYGLKRRDTDQVLVTNDTDIPRISLGTYQYDLDDPDPMPSGYEYWIEVVYSGQTHRFRYLTGSAESTVALSVDAMTSLEELERLMSKTGVSVRIDDAATSVEEADMLNEIINDASDIIKQYTWTHYETPSLQGSQWVRRRATWIAAYILSMRRGNPGQFIDRYQNIIEELQAVFSRQLFIPGLNVRVQSVPTVSIPVINNRSYAPVQRVTRDGVETYPGQKFEDMYPEIL